MNSYHIYIDDFLLIIKLSVVTLAFGIEDDHDSA